MTFTFNIISDEVENFKRVIVVDSNATFMELKNAICDSVNYDKNQFCSFFLCEGNWEKTREITMEDMGSSSDEDVYLMDDCVLGDLIEDEGQRLIFNFDYLTDRSFFMEMKEMTPGKTLRAALQHLARHTSPQTVDFDEFNAKARRADHSRRRALTSVSMMNISASRRSTTMSLTRAVSK